MMARELQNVIVIGGSGNIGGPIVAQLLDSNFTVSVLTRSSLQTVFPVGVTVHKTDYTEASLLAALRNQDAVVSAIAAPETKQQNDIIDAAVKAGVKRFVPSEFGVDTSVPNITEVIPTLKAKTDVVAYLKSQETKGLTWTGIVVGAFFDWDLELNVGIMCWDVPNRKGTIVDSVNQRFQATNVAQNARAVAATLLQPQETTNQYIYVNSFSLTQNQVLAALEKATGSKWDISRTSSAELAASGSRLTLISAVVYGKGGVNEFTDKAAKWNKILGLPKEDLDKVVKKAVGNV